MTYDGPQTDWGKLDATHPPERNKVNHFIGGALTPDDYTLDTVESPRNSNWFLVLMAARRAITFLEQQPRSGSRAESASTGIPWGASSPRIWPGRYRRTGESRGRRKGVGSLWSWHAKGVGHGPRTSHAPQLRFAKPGVDAPRPVPRLLHGPRDRDRSPVGFMPGFMPDKEFIKRSE